MALRVLLADESSSIYKVFQLSLQDFAAEIKPVHIGLDVIDVALSFKPDIIFADILLQKLSGYGVSAKINSHPELSHIPVVLMWSSFMNLDEEQFISCGAKGRLEKPFDTDSLRQTINSLVSRTQSNPVAQYTTMPAIELDFNDEETQSDSDISSIEQATKELEQAGANDAAPVLEFSTTSEPAEDSLESLNSELESLSAQLEQTTNDGFEIADINDSGDEWSQKEFKPSIIPDEPSTIASLDLSDIHEKVDKKTNSLSMDDFEVLDLADDGTPDGFIMSTALKNQQPKGHPLEANNIEITEDQLEKALKSISQETLEKVIWRVVPDLATQLIEKEIQRLLAEKDLNQ